MEVGSLLFCFSVALVWTLDSLLSHSKTESNSLGFSFITAGVHRLCPVLCVFTGTPADLEVKGLNERMSGQSFEVILKQDNPSRDPGHPQALPSPPKRDVSLDELQKRLEAAEERRKVRGGVMPPLKCHLFILPRSPQYNAEQSQTGCHQWGTSSSA